MAKPIFILGISCYYHDSAAVLLKDGAVIFAAQEERFTRKKHDEGFPQNAIAAALHSAGITAQDLSAVVFYEKPLLKFLDRIIPCAIDVWPRGHGTFQRAAHEWLTKKLWIPQLIRKELNYAGPLFFTRHHEAHAASAFYPSGFPDAAIVTVDGVGEWATATIGYGRGTDLTLRQEIRFPHSLGLLYSALTYYLGFKVNSAEYKVMGLAPYGDPEKYYGAFQKLIHIKEDGSFTLNMGYFAYEYGLAMTSKKLDELFGGPAREPESELTQRHKDIAAALQKITEEAILKIVRQAKASHPSKNICLAGGVALNCVANGKILQQNWFENIYIQPASGDAGGAIG